jgi:hypothetical protein
MFKDYLSVLNRVHYVLASIIPILLSFSPLPEVIVLMRKIYLAVLNRVYHILVDAILVLLSFLVVRGCCPSS